VLGVMTFLTADPKYKSDVDVYRMDFDTDSAVTWTMSWPDQAANIDMLLFAGDGTPVMAAYNKGAGDVNPEVMSTNDLGSLLKAGETWYLVVYAWTGPAGDYPYKIEIAVQ
jgi:hypothetical protein